MRRRATILLAVCAATALAPVRPAHAVDRDVRAVLIGGLYGMAGGTILGLASYPFTQKPRSIFIGTSIGLYLGIAVGFYYIWNRYDPENPLQPEHRQAPWEQRREPPPSYYNFRYTPEGDALAGASFVAARF
jgi:hypothetical protein